MFYFLPFIMEFLKLNRNKFKSCFLLSIFLLQIFMIKNSYATSYFGSYLFCSSENGLRGDEYWNRKVHWKWSMGKTFKSSQLKMNDKYKSFTFVNNSGTWINGFGDISANTLQHFLLVRNTFENKEEAIHYCKFLEKKCEYEFGPNHKYVGVSSWSIPQTAWGTIAVRYKEDKDTKWTTCSNWKYTGYKELNYYPVWKVAGLTSVAAAGIVISSVTINALGSLLDYHAFLEPLWGSQIGTAFGTFIGIDIAYKIYEYAFEKISLNENE
jgi:hypothetical protein